MKRNKSSRISLIFAAMIGVTFIAACSLPPAGDTSAPTVISTVPLNAAAHIGANGAVTATFSEGMDPATIIAANFTVMAGATAVAGTIAYDVPNKTAIFAHTVALASGTLYTATIKTGAKDLAGNPLAANKVWTFTVADTVAPVVSSTLPANAATGVLINSGITATFSEAMDPLTLTTTTFTLKQGTTPVTGTVTRAATTATFTPASALSSGTVYTATVTTGAKDVAGNALSTNKVWTFTTALGPSAVNLGTAGDFVILAQTAVTDIPTSAITGDIGLSPNAESNNTGFSETLDVSDQFATSPQVTGKMYAADMAVPTPANLTTAVLDMQAAYTDAAGRSTPDHLDLLSGAIGGQTLAPGLYTWEGAVTLSTDVTFAGGVNDVWILQVSGGVTVASGVHVILSGGAQAKNIFWQLAGIATLGTNSHFEGIILSQTQIVIETGASLHGRALAQTQVTLDQNAVTQP